MSANANVPAQGQMTSLVESIREVQKIQAQARAQLAELEAAEDKPPSAASFSGGTINVSDATQIIVEGATGTFAYMNGVYSYNSVGVLQRTPAGSQYMGPTFIKNLKGPISSMIYFSGSWIIQGKYRERGGWVPLPYVQATGPYAKNPQQIPVGGPQEPWQAAGGGDNADVSGIRLWAPSKADEAANAKKRAELLTQITDLEGIENTLLDDLRAQRLAAASATGATELALKAEAKAAKMLEEESAQQRKRLAQERGQEAKDTALITAARSTALRAQAYTRVTLVGIVVLIAAFVIYRLRFMELIDNDISFVLSVAAGAAALIVGTAMLNNIYSRNPRDFSKFYFEPPAGPSALAAGAFSSANADGQSLQSCQRALRAARNV
jgi:hypothetical protein